MNRILYLKNLSIESPEDPFIPYALALEYVKLDQAADAQFYFENVLKLNPNYLAVYYQYGRFLFTQSQAQQAIATLNTGIEIAKIQNDKHTLSELLFLLEDIEDTL
jgi:predicted Zn-dependent protease